MKLVIAALALVLIGAGAFAFYQFGTRTIHGMTGPAIGRGNSTEPIDEIVLGAEIPGFDGYNMRARYVVVRPGGRIRIHNHTGRPAFSYIVNAPVVEYRSDRLGEAIAHQPGALTADSNISQWWRNDSGQTARWYVVDIYRTGGNAGE